MALGGWAWLIGAGACLALGAHAQGADKPIVSRKLQHASHIHPRAAWHDNASPLMCVQARSPRQPSSDTSVSVPSDPRYTLISDNLLLCELSSQGEGAGAKMYALLGTVVVPGETPLAVPEAASAPVAPRPSLDDGHTNASADEAARAAPPGGGDPLLSFDEWKEQHLESVRKSRKLERERKHEGAANETETFEAPTTTPAPPPPHETPNATLPVTEQVLLHAMATEPEPPVILALEDASAQLAELKHRWNYASLDCAAVLHQANPSAKFPSAILSEKKDRYMLSPCPHAARAGEKEAAHERQFVIVELCQQIRVDTLVLANLEFFSSIFKMFSVRVSRTLHAPETEWKSLGLFRARNVRGPQVFRLDSAPASYYRFLRIDFLEHYGNEYYCPISLLRVYGRNEREDADEDLLDEIQAMDDDDAESDAEAVDTEARAREVSHTLPRRVCVPEPFPGVWPPQCAADEAPPPTAHDAPRTAAPTPTGRASTPPTAPTSGATVSATEAHPANVSVPPMSALGGESTASARPSAAVNSTADDDVRKADTRAKPKDKGKSAEKPAGSESIYRTITKRLSALEANTSLSMQFLQLNSEQMRDKISRLERVQETRLEELLGVLNATQTQRMDDRMAQYQLALQHALATIESQRRRAEAERAALLGRVERLAMEMRTEKRWSAAQLVLLLLVLLITALTRGSREVQRGDGAPWRIAMPPRDAPRLFQTPLSPPAEEEELDEQAPYFRADMRVPPRPVALKMPRRAWASPSGLVRRGRARRGARRVSAPPRPASVSSSREGESE
ncbi:hypothetical protein MCAP1_003278 [Malassezia caprae]|uniref:SUN domain-containing protein n=1 Tax=Malassezia caprae TaxID=1381934 RepID=A0AAF0IY40_9BASI|nr:hypothetical protein MCAP1_003278 [Malassezia caprae]